VIQGRQKPLSGRTASGARVPAGLPMLAAALALVLLIAIVSAGGAGAAAKQPAPIIGGLFNQRYCEIFKVGNPTSEGFPVTIFNTVGLNDCPTATWDAIDYDAIRTSEDLLAAVPNGPRRWLVDAVQGRTNGVSVDVGGLMMRPVASLVTQSLSPAAFTETKIARNNSWIFRKGRTIHEVVSPTGTRYVMQAYTRTVDPTLTPKTLSAVGRNPLAEIPTGWKFRSRTLKRKLVVRSNGMATIVRDGLRSVYQKYKPPKRKRR
jgi:hypothetical protein